MGSIPLTLIITLFIISSSAKTNLLHKEDAAVEERIELRLIVVPTLEQVEEIYGELQEGRPFWEIAGERSNHPSSSEGGFVSIKAGELDKGFKEVLSGIKEGEYSRPFKAEGGYMIIQITTTRYFKQALDLYLKGSIDEAVGEFMKDLHLNPDRVYSYIALGAIYDRKGDFEKALEMYGAALSLDPENETVYNNLGTTYFNMGRVKAAIESYRKALEVAPDSHNIKNNLSWVYASKGINLDEGISMMKDVLSKEPKNSLYIETLAELYYKKGLYEEAAAEIRKVIELEPDNEEFRLRLKKIEEAKDRRLHLSMREEKKELDIGISLRDVISEGTRGESKIVTEAERDNLKDRETVKGLKIKILTQKERSEKEIVRALEKMGYKVSMIGNAEKSSDYIIIYFKKGFRDVALRIDKGLQGRQVLRPLSWPSQFDIIILLTDKEHP